ncbi:DUF1830 domain-containing protein [Roseofilum casamattae]|uniref:DUF1830 domain-containing protein n=1 Tax=Roseofilum casamattae BLCC-M143 TaxID=3022442 RepID=A0ABT7BVA7_9CYAN|nr:DUF1830 domain-containing protein [Roseofilum casamattae]MDJ1182213.1 DUF1830 domain-containing protein [Roseofilum casamattae BLCC-M143]
MLLYPTKLNDRRWTICYYKNQTQIAQLLQINNIENWSWEAVLRPQEWTLFEAPENAQLEISYQTPMDRIQPDIIPCSHLGVRYSIPDGQNTLKLKSCIV